MYSKLSRIKNVYLSYVNTGIQDFHNTTQLMEHKNSSIQHMKKIAQGLHRGRTIVNHTSLILFE